MGTPPSSNSLRSELPMNRRYVSGTASIGRRGAHARRARRIKTQADAALKGDRLKPNEAMRLVDEYEKMFQSYTYLDFNARRPNGSMTNGIHTPELPRLSR